MRVITPSHMSLGRRGRHRGEEGYLLLIALFVLILTMAMSSALAAAITLRMERLERQHANIQLTALLDGALARSLAELVLHPGWRGTGGNVSFGDGTYAVEAEWIGNSRVAVRMSASYGQYGRAARAEIDTHLKSVVEWGPLPFDPLSADGIPQQKPRPSLPPPGRAADGREGRGPSRDFSRWDQGASLTSTLSSLSTRRMGVK